MFAPNYIQKGLKAIDGMYFAVFNPNVKGGMSAKKGRWQVRKWLGVYPKRLDLWDTDMSEAILTICKEEMTDDGLVDAGYEDIDSRVIFAIRKSHYWKLDWKRKIAEMDWKNDRLRRQADAELDYQSKYVARQAWHMEREPHICLSGKDWRI